MGIEKGYLGEGVEVGGAFHQVGGYGLAVVVGAEQLENGQKSCGTPCADTVPDEAEVAFCGCGKVGHAGASGIDGNDLPDDAALG